MKMPPVITEISQLTSGYLRQVLAQRAGGAGKALAGFTVEPLRSDNARMVRLHLHYGGQVKPAWPQTLVLKMCASGQRFGASEVHYYLRDYTDCPDAPMPLCYDGQYDSQTRAYHLLLADLSTTHQNNWRTRPTLAYGCAVVEALARLHAHYWTADRLAHIGVQYPGAPEIARYVQHVRQGLATMLSSVAGVIGQAQREALQEIFAQHPAKMLERAANPSGFTLIHGDPNPGNILSPRHGQWPIYLIDRQPFDWSLLVWLGVSDVAYMMVHWWDTDLRRHYELPILRHYHHSLQRLGVESYSWEQLCLDYRLCAVQSIYVATEWCVDEREAQSMRWVWLPQLQKALQAYVDLHCDGLWKA